MCSLDTLSWACYDARRMKATPCQDLWNEVPRCCRVCDDSRRSHYLYGHNNPRNRCHSSDLRPCAWLRQCKGRDARSLALDLQEPNRAKSQACPYDKQASFRQSSVLNLLFNSSIAIHNSFCQLLKATLIVGLMIQSTSVFLSSLPLSLLLMLHQYFTSSIDQQTLQSRLSRNNLQIKVSHTMSCTTRISSRNYSHQQPSAPPALSSPLQPSLLTKRLPIPSIRSSPWQQRPSRPPQAIPRFSPR